MKPFAILAFALLLFQPGLPAIRGVAKETPPGATCPQYPEITFHSSSNLVLVDVFARDGKNGLPDKTLKREDFQVLDNDRPVSIKTFDNGAQLTTRPFVLWFVVQCHMQDWEKEGSGLFAGQIALFEPALKYLEKQDTVAVAHWCDNGDSQLDLQPTPNVEEATTTLEQVLTLTPDAHQTDRPGELALQKTLQLITEAARAPVPRRLRVVVGL
jgi:hypothetical protein